MNTKVILTATLSLFLGVFILLTLDQGTLFLATLLISIVSIKTINKKIESDRDFDTTKISVNVLVGLWFALSIAPAYGVKAEEVSIVSNGFLIQTLLSFFLFLAFYKSDISIIGKIKVRVQGAVGIIVSALIAGAAAGISSSALWQVYLNISKAL
jgi:phosphatidylglycerophosphatase A